MLGSVTPFTLFHGQVRTLRAHLPEVFDGDADGVHDARVATRRIRELLPLIAQGRKTLEDVATRFKQIGRALGRVRDADVRIALLSSLETRVPHAAPSLLVVRQQHERARLSLMRKLIKNLERSEIGPLLNDLTQHQLRARPLAVWASGTGTWRRQLHLSVNARAQSAGHAIAHATGVYFPNRVHSARIGMKKLRYALEIAEETRLVLANDSVERLKKAQDLLGDLHDRQTLIDELNDSNDHPRGVSEQLELVVQLVEAECGALHERYLRRRDQLLETCRAHAQPPASRLAPVVTAGVVAVSSGYLVRRGLMAPDAAPSKDIGERMPAAVRTP